MRISQVSITILCAGLLLLFAPASLAGTTDFGTGLLELDPPRPRRRLSPTN